MNHQRPDYLVIGHVAKDRMPGGAILGGTVSYAALTAHKLGQRTAAVTSYGPDLPSLAALDGVKIKNVPHPHSTRFENIYAAGGRRQIWTATAGQLSLESVPSAWQKTPIAHLAPLSQEMSPAMIGQFPDSLICVTLQGWLRGYDSDYTVTFQPHPELEKWLPHIDILILSLADLSGDRDKMTHLLNTVKLGVETAGSDGCYLYQNGQTKHVPVQPEVDVEPTGAGDIFAAAFFVRYQETKDAVQAAQFANACGSLSVRKVGMDSIPTRPEVEAHELEMYGD